MNRLEPACCFSLGSFFRRVKRSRSPNIFSGAGGVLSVRPRIKAVSCFGVAAEAPERGGERRCLSTPRLGLWRRQRRRRGRNAGLEQLLILPRSRAVKSVIQSICVYVHMNMCVCLSLCSSVLEVYFQHSAQAAEGKMGRIGGIKEEKKQAWWKEDMNP